jgi:hypothetical protein
VPSAQSRRVPGALDRPTWSTHALDAISAHYPGRLAGPGDGGCIRCNPRPRPSEAATVRGRDRPRPRPSEAATGRRPRPGHPGLLGTRPRSGLVPAPAYTRFVDAWDAMDRLRRIVESGSYRRFDSRRSRVTYGPARPTEPATRAAAYRGRGTEPSVGRPEPIRSALPTPPGHARRSAPDDSVGCDPGGLVGTPPGRQRGGT